MTACIYSAKMPWGDTLRISVDLDQASSPITFEGAEEGVWCSTPYQTADAQHRDIRAMMLVVRYMGREWFAQPNDTRPEDKILAGIRKSITIEYEGEA